MIDEFEPTWNALYENGSSQRNKEATRHFWDTLTPEQQHAAFTNITRKRNENRFLQYDPIRAIKENIRTIKVLEPTFLRGDEKGYDLVQVHYQDRFLICTRQTMQQFGLEYVRDWLPVE